MWQIKIITELSWLELFWNHSLNFYKVFSYLLGNYYYNPGDPSLIPGLGKPGGEGIDYSLQYSWASLVAQLAKNPPAMWETWVRSLGWKDPLEKGTAPVFWPGEFHGLYCIVHGVTESWTQLSNFHFTGKLWQPKASLDISNNPCLRTT